MIDLKFKTENKKEELVAKRIAERVARQPVKLRKPASDKLPTQSISPKQKMGQSEPQKRVWVSYRLFHYYYPKKNRQGLGAYFAVVGRMSYHTKFGLHIANADHLKWQQAHKVDDRIKDGRRIGSHPGHRHSLKSRNGFASHVSYLSQSVVFRSGGRGFGASVPVSQGVRADDFIYFSPAVTFTDIQRKNNHVSHSELVRIPETGPQSAPSSSASLPSRAMDIDGADDFPFVPIAVPISLFVSSIPAFSAGEANGNWVYNTPNSESSLSTTYPNVLKNVFEKWHGWNVPAVTAIQNKNNGKSGSMESIESAGHETRISQALSRSSALETQNAKLETHHPNPKTLNPALETGNPTLETMRALPASSRSPSDFRTGNWKPVTPYIYSLRPHRLKHQSVIGAEALPE